MTDKKHGEDGLKMEFREAVKMELQNKEVAALMTGGVDTENPVVLPGGLLSKLGLTPAKLAELEAKKADKNFQDWLFREAVRQSLIHINIIINDIQNRMADILDRMEKADEELSVLDDQRETLSEELRHYQEAGFFDVDENGRLKNPEAEDILAEYERKTGQRKDLTDPACYELMLKILMDIDQRRVVLRESMKKDAMEYEYLKQRLGEALLIQEGLGSNNADENRQALLAFDEFFNFYDEDFTPEPFKQAEISDSSGDIVTRSFDSQMDNPEDDTSFGFAPLTEDFGRAASDNEIMSKPPPDKTNHDNQIQVIPLKPNG